MQQQEESDVGLPGGNGQLLTIGLGLLATALAAAYVTRLAKVLLFFTDNYPTGKRKQLFIKTISI